MRRLLLRPERLYHPTIGFYEHIPGWRIKAYVGDAIWNAYFKFTFERNPWDKQISWYYYKTKSRKRRPTFEAFMENKEKALVDNYPLYTINGEIAVDFVGLYENLTKDLMHVLDVIGVPNADPLPKLNAFGQRQDYRSHYTGATRRLVEEWYEREIKTFGYQF